MSRRKYATLKKQQNLNPNLIFKLYSPFLAHRVKEKLYCLNTSILGTKKTEDLAMGDNAEMVDGTLDSWLVISGQEESGRKTIPDNHSCRYEKVKVKCGSSFHQSKGSFGTLCLVCLNLGVT